MHIPNVSNLVELLEFRRTHDGQALAYAYTADGRTISQSLTYADWYDAAQKTARGLRDHAKPGDRAILLFPTGPDFIITFFACQIAGVIAVPAQLSRRQGKVLSMARNCGAKLLLSTAEVFSKSDRWEYGESLRTQLRWIAIDELNDGDSALATSNMPKADDLAYLQYTSGSTSNPKGVMISHANVLANVDYINYIQQNDDDSVFVTWLPHFHDMGLVEGLLEPLYTGRPAYVLSPADFIHSPIRWLRAITSFQATNSGGPTFSYELCVDKISPEEASELDLGSWREAYCGAEPVRPQTLKSFHAKFKENGFRWKTFIPSYGLAEATLLVSSYRLEEEAVINSYDDRRLEQGRAVNVSSGHANARLLAASGRACHNSEVRIVDPRTMDALPECTVGEVWISGPHVAGGYWPGTEDDEPAFRARMTGDDRKTYLRTGDLGFLECGNLFVTGRLKELIIIRGRNIYPADIEAIVQNTDERFVKGRGVAFSTDEAGIEKLVVVQELKRGAKLDDVAAVMMDIRENIAGEYEIVTSRIVLVRVSSIPITTSGKLRRNECRKRLDEGTLPILADG